MLMLHIKWTGKNPLYPQSFFFWVLLSLPDPLFLSSSSSIFPTLSLSPVEGDWCWVVGCGEMGIDAGISKSMGLMLDRWVAKGWPEDSGENLGWAQIDERHRDDGGGLGRAWARLERRRGEQLGGEREEIVVRC